MTPRHTRPDPGPRQADLLAVIRAGLDAAVAASDYVDLPPHLVTERAWNQTRHAISETFGAPGQAHELLRQYNLSTEPYRTWDEFVAHALRTGGA